LPENERKVIELRFGTTGEGERTRAQVSRELGVTPRQAEALEERALSRLAAMGELEDLREAA
ncbi:MAG TPA: sigma factor-like helix-turn-helix DNA-binding protein, partial [Solirubrobacteraceae bacterium]|nr:sigma factor-like helix-turn-helix DNA-binding protein [Solirubrobacteraceae bacterium]